MDDFMALQRVSSPRVGRGSRTEPTSFAGLRRQAESRGRARGLEFVGQRTRERGEQQLPRQRDGELEASGGLPKKFQPNLHQCRTVRTLLEARRRTPPPKGKHRTILRLTQG